MKSNALIRHFYHFLGPSDPRVFHFLSYLSLDNLHLFLEVGMTPTQAQLLAQPFFRHCKVDAHFCLLVKPIKHGQYFSTHGSTITPTIAQILEIDIRLQLLTAPPHVHEYPHIKVTFLLHTHILNYS